MSQYNPGCFHHLVWFFEQPYRYRCLKCWAKLKIASGYLLSDEKQKEWLNVHGEKWPWEQEP